MELLQEKRKVLDKEQPPYELDDKKGRDGDKWPFFFVNRCDFQITVRATRSNKRVAQFPLPPGVSGGMVFHKKVQVKLSWTDAVEMDIKDENKKNENENREKKILVQKLYEINNVPPNTTCYLNPRLNSVRTCQIFTGYHISRNTS
uniref:Uncharacterized protein n=1 Tax=Marseillevirus LCMAC101 TaxID=2506602 RepID=A0A481YUH1_9VIRU|nr:MAG: hypothetical protein LCMAC101_07690 [Marseillevirus LCMAC101]